MHEANTAASSVQRSAAATTHSSRRVVAADTSGSSSPSFARDGVGPATLLAEEGRGPSRGSAVPLASQPASPHALYRAAHAHFSSCEKTTAARTARPRQPRPTPPGEDGRTPSGANSAAATTLSPAAHVVKRQARRGMRLVLGRRAGRDAAPAAAPARTTARATAPASASALVSAWRQWAARAAGQPTLEATLRTGRAARAAAASTSAARAAPSTAPARGTAMTNGGRRRSYRHPGLAAAWWEPDGLERQSGGWHGWAAGLDVAQARVWAGGGCGAAGRCSGCERSGCGPRQPVAGRMLCARQPFPAQRRSTAYSPGLGLGCAGRRPRRRRPLCPPRRRQAVRGAPAAVWHIRPATPHHLLTSPPWRAGEPQRPRRPP